MAYIYLTIIVILLLVVIYFGYLLYKGSFPTMDQRVWPVPKKLSDKELILLTAESVMDGNKLFLAERKMGEDLSIFKDDKELDAFKQESIKYFKRQFGLSDTFINMFLFELRVNDKAGYNAYYSKSEGTIQTPIIDGGFIVFVPKGTTLHGLYGGTNGVTIGRPATLAFGYYIIGDKYKIKYYSPCPLQIMMTYDANYGPVDCDVEILESPNKATIGLKGKAIGIYKNIKLSNGLNGISIRNVLTF